MYVHIPKYNYIYPQFLLLSAEQNIFYKRLWLSEVYKPHDFRGWAWTIKIWKLGQWWRIMTSARWVSFWRPQIQMKKIENTVFTQEHIYIKNLSMNLTTKANLEAKGRQQIGTFNPPSLQFNCEMKAMERNEAEEWLIWNGAEDGQTEKYWRTQNISVNQVWGAEIRERGYRISNLIHT